MHIMRFSPEHLKSLELQNEQQWMRELLNRADYGPALALGGPAFTAMDGETTLGCGGVMEHGKHRAEVWALLSRHIGPHMRAITRAVNGWLAVCPYQRVEANVATHFDAGQRWIKLLGFHQEGAEKMRFFADGRSALAFVRFPKEAHRVGS